MLKNVVLPAPFGPIRLTIEPCGTVKLTSSTATSPPHSLRSASVTSRFSGTGYLGVVQRLVVHAFVELGRSSRARDQPLGPEEHDDDDDRAEDAELVQRHVEVRAEVAVDPRADVRQPFAVEIREEARAEDDAPDVPHASEDDHAEDEDRDLEEEVVRERAALVRRVVRGGDVSEAGAGRVRPRLHAAQ